MEYTSRDPTGQFAPRQPNWHRSSQGDPLGQVDSEMQPRPQLPPHLQGAEPRDFPDGPFDLRIPRQDMKAPMSFAAPGPSTGDVRSAESPSYGGMGGTAAGGGAYPGGMMPGNYSGSGGAVPPRFPGSPMFSASAAAASAILGSATQSPALLKAYYAAIGATPSPRRQRSEKKAIPDEQKDDKYFERRRRNNGAAKRSRDLRKRREDEIAIRASYLEKENSILKAQAQHLREEAAALRQLVLERQRR